MRPPSSTDSADSPSLNLVGVDSHAYRIALWLDTSIPIRRAANVFFLLLVTYMTVLPAGRNSLLIPLLAVAAGIGATRLSVRVVLRDPPPKALRLILLPAVAGLVPVSLGFFFGTPGWADVAVPLVAAPVAWFFIAHGADDWAVQRLVAAVAVGTILLSTMIFMLVTGVGASVVQVLHPRAFGVSGDGGSRVSITGASSLIWAVPLLGVVVFEGTRRGERLLYKYLLLTGLLFGLVGAFLSGRQGVVGALLLAPLVLLALTPAGFGYTQRALSDRRTVALRIAGLVMIGAAGLGVATVVGVNPTQLPADVADAIGLGQDIEKDRIRAGSGTRNRQAASFITGWKESPLYGHGAGAVSPEFYTWRGYEIGDVFVITPRPWRAEMHYHLLLFEAGLLGLFAYGATILKVVADLRDHYRWLPDARRVLIRAGLVSATAVTIATAYNPLVRALGGQLPLYLPMIFVAARAIPARSRRTRE